MSPEVALLLETWDIVKAQIAKKEQLPIAEALVRSFEDHIGIDDIEDHVNEFDKVMKAAIVSHFALGEDSDADWD